MRLKKVAAIFMAAAMTIGCLAGCGGSPSDSTKPATTKGSEKESGGKQETKSMTLTVWASQEDQASSEKYPDGILKTLCEKFNEEHEEYDITFKYGVMSEADAAESAMKDLEAAADVFMYANDQIPKMVEAGALARFGGKTVEEMEKHNSKEMVQSVTYQDGVYGVPFTPNTYFLYYDKSKYSEDDVKSLDKMMEKDLGDGVHNFACSIGNSWYLPAFFYAAGGELFGPNGDDAEAGTTFGECVNATEYVIDLANNKKFFREESGASLAKFKDGTLGAFISGSWDAEAIKNGLGENFGVTKLPTIKLDGKDCQLYSFAGSKCVGANPKSKNMAAAVALAAYLGGEEAQKVRFEARSITPTWDTIAESDEVKKDPVASAQILQINEASKTQPILSKMNDFWSPMESLGKAILQGDVTKDSAEKATKQMGEGITK